jgi:hypothetical protein
MLTDMEEKCPSNWRWWLLAAGLGFVHFWLCVFVEFNFGPLASLNPSNFPRYQPSWFYYVFMNVFIFPWSVIFPLMPRGPKIHPSPHDEVIVLFGIILTCFLWGMVWAEPFRRKFRWRPWRFSIREVLALTTGVAGLLGGLRGLISGAEWLRAQRATSE